MCARLKKENETKRRYTHQVNFVCVDFKEVLCADLHFVTQFLNHFSKGRLQVYSVNSRVKVDICNISHEWNVDEPLHTRTQIVMNMKRYVCVTLAVSTLTVLVCASNTVQTNASSLLGVITSCCMLEGINMCPSYGTNRARYYVIDSVTTSPGTTF